MRVRMWGVRGSIPTPGSKTEAFGGNTSCVQVGGDDGTELILDAGSGIRELGTDLFGRRRKLHVLLTHLHLDHIQGLLFFAPMFDPEAEITVWGPPGRTHLRKRLARYLSNPLSPVEIRDLPARVAFEEVPADGWRLDEFGLRAALVAHRGPTLGYRIEQSGASLCYLPDHEPGLGASLSSRPAGWISGLGLARGATALIHDAQYTDEEYPSRRGWGHSSLSDALAFAQRSQPENLLLFHQTRVTTTSACGRSGRRQPRTPTVSASTAGSRSPTRGRFSTSDERVGQVGTRPNRSGPIKSICARQVGADCIDPHRRREYSCGGWIPAQWVPESIHRGDDAALLDRSA